ncbi:CPBP family intramembrane glutamic endopeptidase [Modestobacter marinus]|uniref:CPBP family intramembrane glutamic endopeptidase n=1 Tax=Modestobacter marinus TaxID=477641 RepID=UPI001C939C76|nr:CPBP family intramembrane glutamic endopeptidase [Modestobacter marinus]
MTGAGWPGPWTGRPANGAGVAWGGPPYAGQPYAAQPNAGQPDAGRPDTGPSYAGPPATGRYGAPPQVPIGMPAGPPPGAVAVPGPPAPGGRGRRAPRPVTPPGAPPFDAPQSYPFLMRARDWAWWRPALGLLLFGVVYTVASVVVVLVAFVTGTGPDLGFVDLTDPWVLLVTNLSLIVAIPIVWLCWAVPHGLRIGWSSSVLGRLRWRLFLPYTWRAVATLGAAIALSVALSLLTDELISGPVPALGWLLLVVFLTTPLQSAAEEYLFRGYLSQAIAAWIRAPRAGPVVAAVVTAALFSSAHLPPDFLTFFDRFVFGLAASAVVSLTGGLEAAIVLHAVNNVLVFVIAGLLGDGADTDATLTGLEGLLVVLLDVVAMGAYVAVVARSRSRVQPELRSPAVDLRGALPAGPPSGAQGAIGPSTTYAVGYAGAPPAGSPYARPSGAWHVPEPTGPPPPDERWSRRGAPGREE